MTSFGRWRSSSRSSNPAMIQETFRGGAETLIQEDAPSGRWSAFFEDDRETGYFYAVDLERQSVAFSMPFTFITWQILSTEIVRPRYPSCGGQTSQNARS